MKESRGVTGRGLRTALTRDLPRGFVGNISWQSGSSLGAAFLSFLYAILVARALGASEFGLVVLALSFGAIVSQLFDLRLHEAVIRYVAELWEGGDRAGVVAAVKVALAVEVGAGALALLTTLAAAGWAGTYLVQDPRGVTAVVLAGVGVFLANAGNATGLGTLRVFLAFRSLALVGILREILKLAAALGAIWLLGAGALGVLVATLGARVVANVLQFGLAIRYVHGATGLSVYRARPATVAHRFPTARRFVANTYVVSLTNIPTKELDVNLLAWFGSLEAVGIYRVAKNFVAGLWTVVDSAFLVVYPELARMWARKAFADIRRFLKRFTILFAAGGAALYGIGYLLVPPLVGVAVGPEFVEAGPLFRAMAWGIVFWAPLSWVNPLYLAASRPDIIVRASIIGSLIVVVLYLACIPAWGGLGAAMVYAVATPVILALALSLGWHDEVLDPLRARSGA